MRVHHAQRHGEVPVVLRFDGRDLVPVPVDVDPGLKRQTLCRDIGKPLINEGRSRPSNSQRSPDQPGNYEQLPQALPRHQRCLRLTIIRYGPYNGPQYVRRCSPPLRWAADMAGKRDRCSKWRRIMDHPPLVSKTTNDRSRSASIAEACGRSPASAFPHHSPNAMMTMSMPAASTLETRRSDCALNVSPSCPICRFKVITSPICTILLRCSGSERCLARGSCQRSDSCVRIDARQYSVENRSSIAPVARSRFRTAMAEVIDMAGSEPYQSPRFKQP